MVLINDGTKQIKKAKSNYLSKTRIIKKLLIFDYSETIY